eukprot:s880_g4.t1
MIRTKIQYALHKTQSCNFYGGSVPPHAVQLHSDSVVEVCKRLQFLGSLRNFDPKDWNGQAAAPTRECQPPPQVAGQKCHTRHPEGLTRKFQP